MSHASTPRRQPVPRPVRRAIRAQIFVRKYQRTVMEMIAIDMTALEVARALIDWLPAEIEHEALTRQSLTREIRRYCPDAPRQAATYTRRVHRIGIQETT